ncbi:hypothetical protein AAFF_G00400440 [Aldrovandia affinis]|uniref:Uncharacterized protein n=1 Tax=Aldrovandia affinis TaxID=143900 RepID=A0AAD7WKG9_9TELE|nr:hypothetical protein AAFF_G00400440 [Aldrovandia affinis]
MSWHKMAAMHHPGGCCTSVVVELRFENSNLPRRSGCLAGSVAARAKHRSLSRHRPQTPSQFVAAATWPCGVCISHAVQTQKPRGSLPHIVCPAPPESEATSCDLQPASSALRLRLASALRCQWLGGGVDASRGHTASIMTRG